MDSVKIDDVLDTRTVNNIDYKLVLIQEGGVPTKLWIPEYSPTPTKVALKPDFDVEKRVIHLYDRLKKASQAEKLVVQEKIVRLHLYELPPSKKKKIRSDIFGFLETHKLSRKVCPTGLRELRQRVLHEEIVQKRRHQLSLLFCLEKEMNLVSKSAEKIHLENFVDLEVLPFNFSYVNKNVPGERVTFPKNPPIGCDCLGERICVLNNCCPEMFSRQSPYNEHGLVTVSPGTAIYECNQNCKCMRTCANRVVQRGSQVKMMIFRTQNYGWGVRTLEPIPKGSFVIEYTGEVITRENAIQRSKNIIATHHLFDLDFNTEDGECKYTIDSTFYGNVSRFLNHSCEPNLNAFCVWINWSAPDIYHLALFASRDILSGEELTFDYAQLSKSQDRTIRNCKCGSKVCRYAETTS